MQKKMEKKLHQMFIKNLKIRRFSPPKEFVLIDRAAVGLGSVLCI